MKRFYLLLILSGCVSINEQYENAYRCARLALPGLKITHLTCEDLHRYDMFSCTAVLENGTAATVVVDGHSKNCR